MQERRKHLRIKDNLVVKCYIPRGSRVEEFGKSQDISAGGIRISIPKEAIKGDVLDLDINILSDAIPIPVKGRVVWAKEEEEREDKYSVGIEFSNLGEFIKERVSGYLKRKMRK